jgi:sigma-B regulation protein RsbU (phosphoserine phosphatase)
MLMTVVHALFRLSSAHESNPARIMQIINEVACQNGESNMFVTLFIGVLDMPTGHLRYCDAGHDAPFVLPDTASSTANAQLPVNPHLPVGVFDDTKYVAQEIVLQEACLIFLYTDGLTEARNAAHKLFGLKRIESVLNDCIGSTPENTLDTIVQSVDDFVKDAEQSDDLTMLAVRYIPHRFESILTETLVIKNEVHEVKRLSEFLKSVSQQLDVSTSVANQLRLAVEEAVVNVIDYAYPIGTEGDINIRVLSDGKTVRIQIIDKGQAFDPTAMQRADTTLSAEERNIGGLGILLVREQMDSINYERTDGKNVLTLIKKIK